MPRKVASQQTLILRDPRGSRWDGVVQEGVLATCESLERGVTPGEVGIFTLTDGVETVTVTEVFREGPKTKEVTARVYRRTGSRFY